MHQNNPLQIRITTDSYELIFFLQLYFRTSKTHISRIKKSYSKRWFSDKEKLQAKLPKFAITIALKCKNERKKIPKTKNANLLNCSVSMMLIMYPQTTTQNIQRHVTNKNEKKSFKGSPERPPVKCSASGSLTFHFLMLFSHFSTNTQRV